MSLLVILRLLIFADIRVTSSFFCFLSPARSPRRARGRTGMKYGGFVTTAVPGAVRSSQTCLLPLLSPPAPGMTSTKYVAGCDKIASDYGPENRNETYITRNGLKKTRFCHFTVFCRNCILWFKKRKTLLCILFFIPGDRSSEKQKGICLYCIKAIFTF